VYLCNTPASGVEAQRPCQTILPVGSTTQTDVSLSDTSSPTYGIVKLAQAIGYGRVPAMSPMPDPYRGFRYPPEIINEAVWLYHCFSLSLREVALILAKHGVEVSHESIRQWCRRFGEDFA
jgi:hypothetical protein